MPDMDPYANTRRIDDKNKHRHIRRETANINAESRALVDRQTLLAIMRIGKECLEIILGSCPTKARCHLEERFMLNPIDRFQDHRLAKILF